MKKVPFAILITIILIIGFVITIRLLWPIYVRYMVKQHQEGVIIELKEFAQDYSEINSFEQAEKAIEMIEYIKHYYPVAPGYWSYSEMDDALEKQRKLTIEIIIEELRKYTGQDHGENLNQWREAIQELKSE